MRFATETRFDRPGGAGDAQRVHDAADAAAQLAARLDALGGNARSLDTSWFWSGAAAEAFRDHLTARARLLLGAADATQQAATALRQWADSVAWAHSRRREAIAVAAEGDQLAAAGIVARAEAHLVEMADRTVPIIRRATSGAPPPANPPAATVGVRGFGPDLPPTAPSMAPPGAVAAKVNEPSHNPGGDPSPPGWVDQLPHNDPRRSHRVVTVAAPVEGSHDTLSAVAARELGDARRWPEIFELNTELPQPGGQALRHPGLVRPGWVLAIPDTSPDTPPPTPPPMTREPADGADPVAYPGQPATGFEPATGVFLAVGVAAALVVAALAARATPPALLARIPDGAPATPPAPPPTYLPPPPPVADTPIHPAIATLAPRRTRTTGLPAGVPAPGQSAPPGRVQEIGIRNGRSLMCDLTAIRGLGLTGIAAPAATRALLLSLLTPPTPHGGPPAEVVMPAEDIHQLLGELDHAPLPAGLRVAPDFAAALAELNLQLLRRTRLHYDPAKADQPELPPLLLIATPHPAHVDELHATLGLGAPLGIGAIVIGEWPTGTTCQLAVDGTITGVTGPAGPLLRHGRLFILPAHHATDLMAVLRPAGPAPSDASASTDQTRAPDANNPPSNTCAPLEPPASPEPPTAAVLTVTAFGQLRLNTRSDPGRPSEDITARLSPKHLLLLARIVCGGPTGTTVDALIDAGWPDTAPEKATRTLHTTLSQLRGKLRAATGQPAGMFLLAVGQRYHLSRDDDTGWVDHWAFRTAIHTARKTSQPEQRITALTRGVGLYTGPLLDGIDHHWANAARHAAHHDAIDAYATLADLLTNTDPDQAANHLTNALDLDPTNEPLARQLIRLHTSHEHQDAANRTYNRLVTALAPLGCHPEPATTGLLDAVAPTSGGRRRSQGLRPRPP